MIQLTGTPKQISWANEIRNSVNNKLDDFCADWDKYLAEMDSELADDLSDPSLSQEDKESSREFNEDCHARAVRNVEKARFAVDHWINHFDNSVWWIDAYTSHQIIPYMAEHLTMYAASISSMDEEERAAFRFRGPISAPRF